MWGTSARPSNGRQREPIYLDYAASAPLLPEAAQAMRALLEAGAPFANPSSIHRLGRAARRVLDEAREAMARELGAQPGELLFTSGGTEADNLALFGAARGMLRQRGRRGVVVSAIEHHAVLEAASRLQQEGFAVEVAACDGQGIVSPAAVEEAIDRLRRAAEAPAVVALMAVNNEVGTLQPVREVAHLARRHGALMMVDAVQAAELDSLRVDELGCDLLALSAHKFGGPQGAGALYVRRAIPFEPLLFGGGQERQLRPGTQNVIGIAGMAAAFMWTRAHRAELLAHRQQLEQRLLEGLRRGVPGLELNAAGAPRLSGLVNVYVPGVTAEMLLVELDLAGVACSAGAACTAGSLQPSHVLTAMGLERSRVEGSVRISLGWATTAEEVDEAVRRFAEAVERLRQRRRAGPRGGLGSQDEGYAKPGAARAARGAVRLGEVTVP